MACMPGVGGQVTVMSIGLEQGAWCWRLCYAGSSLGGAGEEACPMLLLDGRCSNCWGCDMTQARICMSSLTQDRLALWIHVHW